MFRAIALQYACLLRHLVKHCPSDDNSLGEKIWLKPHPGGRERLYCFPLFAHGQLITTSVTSHSNRLKLSLPWLV